MVTKIKHWGNSLALRIPKEIARKVSLHEGSEVVLSVKNNNIVIVKTTKKQDTLLDLVNKITQQNRHELVFSDNDEVEKESWQ